MQHTLGSSPRSTSSFRAFSNMATSSRRNRLSSSSEASIALAYSKNIRNGNKSFTRAIRWQILKKTGNISGINLFWNLGGDGSGSTKFRFFQAKYQWNFDFFRQFSHKKLIFQGKFSKDFRCFQANFWIISIFPCKFSKKFDFSWLIKEIDFFRRIFEKIRFFQAI